MAQKKTVFQLDRAGHYLCEVDAWESPLEPGIYHIPAGAVETPPPDDVPADKWPRFNGSTWELITRPTAPPKPTASEKLTAFLQANPDVAALVTPPTL